VSARSHTDAVQALIGAQVTCYMAEAPNNPTYPYAVLYADQGLGRRSTLAPDTTVRMVTFQTTCVGEGSEAAQWAADKVRAAVEDVQPSVSGWSCGPVQHLASQPVRRDDDVDPAVFYAVDMWRYLATLT